MVFMVLKTRFLVALEKDTIFLLGQLIAKKKRKECNFIGLNIRRDSSRTSSEPLRTFREHWEYMENTGNTGKTLGMQEKHRENTGNTVKT